jgi:TusA-related sulfurtransferase
MGEIHEFDAGMMGCADGLSQEVKRQINAIPVGDTLVVIARDPIAKTDLPALARLIGHTVHSVEMNQSAQIVVTIERGGKEGRSE